ncbi:daptide-type RiPP biosynthesis methyltransferase [Paenarthrobacter sp. FR1]|uniref:daptide-type RiPP biosynthesis methyltransferase n=1 Tax=Paenarthrobacter sp. FR1 TaxID=3439548 RepID=UPI003DA4C1F9
MIIAPDQTVDAILRLLGPLDPPEELHKVPGPYLYDQVTAKDRTEIPELLAEARKTEGPILVLAAGSGRITGPLLALDRPLTAVDSSLDELTRFDVEKRFGCVVLGASSITLLDPSDRRGLFRKVRECLTPDGRFLMTVANADSHQASENNDGGTFVSALGDDSCLITRESRDTVNGARHVTMIHVSFNEGGTYRSSEYAHDVAFVSRGLLEEEISAEDLNIIERRPVHIATPTPGLNDVELWVCGK